MACRPASQRRPFVPYTILLTALTLCILSVATLLHYRYFAAPSTPQPLSKPSPPSATAPPRHAAAGPPADPGAVTVYTYEIVRELPHDPEAFTQGLEFSVYKGRDVFWESTGNYGKSQVREVRSMQAWTCGRDVLRCSARVHAC